MITGANFEFSVVIFDRFHLDEGKFSLFATLPRQEDNQNGARLQVVKFFHRSKNKFSLVKSYIFM